MPLNHSSLENSTFLVFIYFYFLRCTTVSFFLLRVMQCHQFIPFQNAFLNCIIFFISVILCAKKNHHSVFGFYVCSFLRVIPMPSGRATQDWLGGHAREEKSISAGQKLYSFLFIPPYKTFLQKNCQTGGGGCYMQLRQCKYH